MWTNLIYSCNTFISFLPRNILNKSYHIFSRNKASLFWFFSRFSTDETAITVTNSGTVLNQLVQIEGIAVGTSEAGQFDLYFPDVTPGKYNVLYTDYETYSCVYSCEQVPLHGPFRKYMNEKWKMKKFMKNDENWWKMKKLIVFQDSPKDGQ